MNFDLRKHTHLLVVAGSRAYGLHTDTSDVDVKGVAIPPAAYFFGYLQNFDQADKATQIGVFLDDMTDAEKEIIGREKLEGSIYNLVKFCKLAADSNPNILDVLFCRDEEVRYMSPLGERLRANSELFISAKAKHTFSGYAAAQLKRIRGHRAWILNPPKGQPTRAEYDLPEHTLVPKDQLAAAEAAIRKQIDVWNIDYGELSDSEVIHIKGQVAEYLAAVKLGNEADVWMSAARHTGLTENFIELMFRERRYTSAQNEWSRYQGWKKSRNPARAALEEKHGYDTKHGAHLVRLLRMGREIMETGKVNVWRGAGPGPNDREELLGIRNGQWPYDQLVEWAETEDDVLQEMYKQRKYVVPGQPDRKAIDHLCQELAMEALGVKSLGGTTVTM